MISENEIDLDFVKQVIGKPAKHKSYIGIEEILGIVTKHFGVQLSQLHSKRKLKSITLPRQVAMHLARKLTNLSLEEIGGFMGGRDHTTVMHADEKIKNLRKQDRNISATLRKLEATIKKQHKQ
jgi:chromosomal replication initiator protein